MGFRHKNFILIRLVKLPNNLTLVQDNRNKSGENMIAIRDTQLRSRVLAGQILNTQLTSEYDHNVRSLLAKEAPGMLAVLEKIREKTDRLEPGESLITRAERVILQEGTALWAQWIEEKERQYKQVTNNAALEEELNNYFSVEAKYLGLLDAIGISLQVGAGRG